MPYQVHDRHEDLGVGEYDVDVLPGAIGVRVLVRRGHLIDCRYAQV